MYILFVGECYYATGGANDYAGFSLSLDDLLVSKAVRDIEVDGCYWWHIFDTTTQEVVAGSISQAYGAEDLPSTIGEQI